MQLLYRVRDSMPDCVTQTGNLITTYNAIITIKKPCINMQGFVPRTGFEPVSPP
jgi:hypothetical protein